MSISFYRSVQVGNGDSNSDAEKTEEIAGFEVSEEHLSI
jgi:hypothetical protein